jgi:hypothetical protein
VKANCILDRSNALGFMGNYSGSKRLGRKEKASQRCVLDSEQAPSE